MFFKIFICLILFSFEVQAFDSLAPIVKQVMPSVVSVTIDTDNVSDDENIQNNLTFFGVERGFMGSGFIADEEGYVLTNRHVIEKAKDIYITTSDGTKYKGVLVGQDDVLDVAVVKIENPNNMPAAVFSNSDLLEVGDFIMAIGNPFGLKNSVTSGIVSAKGRDMKETPFDDYIQTDAPMNPGNSGGPMFNLKGEVVGLNTSIYAEQGNSLGVGFAIPSNQLKPIYEAIKEKGFVTRNTLGVELKNTRYQDAAALIITTLNDDELCASNDLKVGDMIIRVNDMPIVSYVSFQEKIAWTKPEDTLTLTIVRDEEIENKTVKTKALPQKASDSMKINENKHKKGIYYEKLGLTISYSKVVEVDKTSEAALKGVKAGDEIKALNGRPFFVSDDLNFYIKESLDEQKPLHIGLKDSEGNPYFVELVLQGTADEQN